MKYRSVLGLFVIFLLAACSTVKERVALAAPKYPDAVVVEVKSANGFIANGLLILAIKAGSDSVDSKNILQLLRMKNPAHPIIVNGKSDGLTTSIAGIASGNAVIVTGDSDALTAATLNRALVDGKGSINGSKVVFVGSKDYQEDLSASAAAAGVTIEFLPYP